MAGTDNLQRLGELLLEEGSITAEEIAKSLEETGKRDTVSAKLLSGCGHVRREDLVAFLAKSFEIPQIDRRATSQS